METKQLDALQRAQELMTLTGDDIPCLLIDYASALYLNTAPVPRDIDDIVFPASVHYAQLEENLPCSDPKYMVGEFEKQLFAKVKQ